MPIRNKVSYVGRLKSNQQTSLESPTSKHQRRWREYSIKVGMEYALQEPRYYALWRRYLEEGAHIQEAVKTAFPERGTNELGLLIERALENGEFEPGFSKEFVRQITELLIYHIDSLIEPDMEPDDIGILTDQLMQMLQRGLGNTFK